MPSKQTATGLKGRVKDLEAMENAPEISSPLRKWRKPSFQKDPISGKDFGNLMHTVMQYITYEKCKDISGISSELNRLMSKGFLTEEQYQAVDITNLQNFFSTEIGNKLCNGTPYLREFKFSILDDGIRYDSSLIEEQVLLQGVVDCALLEEDGITVIDFKTDYVTEASVSEIITKYQRQVQTYADALQKIYEQSIKAKYLYLFHLGRFVPV